jgi:hypothetical protein
MLITVNLKPRLLFSTVVYTWKIFWAWILWESKLKQAIMFKGSYNKFEPPVINKKTLLIVSVTLRHIPVPC